MLSDVFSSITATTLTTKNNVNFAAYIEILFSPHCLMQRRVALLSRERSSLVEADFLDQGDCGLLMCGDLIDGERIGEE